MSELLRSFKSGNYTSSCTLGFTVAAMGATVAALLLHPFGYFVTAPIIIGALVAVLNALAWEFFVILFLNGALRDQAQTPLVDPDIAFSGTGANKTAEAPANASKDALTNAPTNMRADVSGLRPFFILKVLCLMLTLGGVLVCSSPQAADVRTGWVLSLLFGYALTLLLGCFAIALSQRNSGNEQTRGSP